MFVIEELQSKIFLNIFVSNFGNFFRSHDFKADLRTGDLDRRGGGRGCAQTELERA